MTADAEIVREALDRLPHGSPGHRDGHPALDRLVAALEAAETNAEIAAANFETQAKVYYALEARLVEVERERDFARGEEKALTTAFHRVSERAEEAEARLVAAEEALREITSRHPAAEPGEHPAVDIARAALERTESSSGVEPSRGEARPLSRADGDAGAKPSEGAAPAPANPFETQDAASAADTPLQEDGAGSIAAQAGAAASAQPPARQDEGAT